MKEKQSLTRFAGVPFAGGAFSLWLLLCVVSLTGGGKMGYLPLIALTSLELCKFHIGTIFT